MRYMASGHSFETSSSRTSLVEFFVGSFDVCRLVHSSKGFCSRCSSPSQTVEKHLAIFDHRFLVKLELPVAVWRFLKWSFQWSCQAPLSALQILNVALTGVGNLVSHLKLLKHFAHENGGRLRSSLCFQAP